MTAVTLVILGIMPGFVQAQVQTFTCASPGFGVVPPGTPLPPAFIPPGGLAIIPPVMMTPLRTIVVNPVLGVADKITGLPVCALADGTIVACAVDDATMPVQALRADLTGYVADLPTAIKLGKALFWDMQVGSDSAPGTATTPPKGTACATCHFQAGADVRAKNQLNAGPNGSFEVLSGQNQTLTSGSFPFPISPTNDDIAGSQGVRASTFQSVNSKTGVETTTKPTGFRQVTGKNTPPMINAVFNHRQFWNSRAQPDFNGVNPWGSRDTSVRVYTLDYRGNPVPVYINIQNASLASQAVGPPLSTVEMSADKRAFPDIGTKMLAANLKPLGLQKVDPADSVLGGLADTTAGLKTTYAALIRTAFQPQWWNSNKTVSISTPHGTQSYSMMAANFSLFWGLSIMLYEATLVADDTPMDRYLASRVITVDPTTRIPYVSSDDPTKLNALVARLQPDLPGLTVTNVLTGLALFELPLGLPPVPDPFPLPDLTVGTTPPGGTTPFPSTAAYNPSLLTTQGVTCNACHFPGELTSASVRNLTGPGVELADVVFKNAGFDLRMERMFTRFPSVPAGTKTVTFDPSNYTVMVTDIFPNSPVFAPWSPVPSLPTEAPHATYDAGFYNIGVRPTSEDPGLDGKDCCGNWLSWTRLFQTTLPDPSTIKVPGNSIPCVVNAAGAFVGNINFPFELVNAAGFALISGPLLRDEPTDVAGTFKTAHLRNVELNGPYFHNGGKSTLRQVLELYNAGGEFDNATKPPAIMPLHLTDAEKNDLVAFLLAFTDERVRFQKVPFDHPQLIIPAGQDSNGNDLTTTIPAVGAGGSGTPLPRFLGLNPFLQ